MAAGKQENYKDSAVHISFAFELYILHISLSLLIS
jgi:hypothetical protein